MASKSRTVKASRRTERSPSSRATVSPCARRLLDPSHALDADRAVTQVLAAQDGKSADGLVGPVTLASLKQLSRVRAHPFLSAAPAHRPRGTRRTRPRCTSRSTSFARAWSSTSRTRARPGSAPSCFRACRVWWRGASRGRARSPRSDGRGCRALETNFVRSAAQSSSRS